MKIRTNRWPDGNPNTKQFWDNYYNKRKVERKLTWLYPEVLKVLPEGCEALEVGCGAGRTIMELKKLRPSVEWTGWDISYSGVLKARERYNKFGGFFIRDVCSTLWSFEKSHDFILCVETLEHLSEPGKAIDNMKTMTLAHGGIVFITVPISGSSLDTHSANLHYVSYERSDFENWFLGWELQMYEPDSQHLIVVARKN